MNICSGFYKTETHEEIIYDEKDCPLCAALQIIKEKDTEIERLNNLE